MHYTNSTLTVDTIQTNQNQVWSETDNFTLERYAQFIRHFLPPTQRILDIGCNTGRGGEVIKRLFPTASIWGIDLIESRIKQCSPSIYDCLICQSADRIPAADNIFDAIVAGEVVEHIPADVLPAVLEECYRVLRPGGRLLLTTPNPASYLVNLRRYSIYGDPSHVNIMTRKTLLQRLINAGFTDNRVTGSGKVCRVLGEKFPFSNVHSSYLTLSQK